MTNPNGDKLQLNTMNPTELAQFLTYTIPARLPVMITGKPGIGKSDIVLQACRAIGADVIMIHAVVSDPTDAKGMPWVRVNVNGDPEAVFIPFSQLKKMLDAKKLTVVFLDDFGQAPPSVQASFMQLILARCIDEFKISDDIVFIAATNRREDLAGVSGMLEPVKSRFIAIIELITNHDAWLDWGMGNDSEIVVVKPRFKGTIPIRPVAMPIIQFIRNHPDWIDKFEATPDMVNTAMPRTITNVSQLIKLELPKHLQTAAYAGAAGTEFQIAFATHMLLYDKIPDPNVCISNPSTAPLPDVNDSEGGASVMYALMGALAAKATINNFESIAKYAKRIDAKEYQVVLMKDATRLTPAIKDCQSFINWATKNANVII
jgi:hypothetical protein